MMKTLLVHDSSQRGRAGTHSRFGMHSKDRRNPIQKSALGTLALFSLSSHYSLFRHWRRRNLRVNTRPRLHPRLWPQTSRLLPLRRHRIRPSSSIS